MKEFKHFNAYSVDEAVALMGRYGERACVIAGGTDILGKMKDSILPAYPEALINIKTIQGLSDIKESGGMLKIGALATAGRYRRQRRHKIEIRRPGPGRRQDRLASPEEHGDHRRQYLPGHQVLVLPQPEQQVLLPAQKGRQVLCHQGRQPLPFHLRRQRLRRLLRRPSQRHRAGAGCPGRQDHDLQPHHRRREVLRGQAHQDHGAQGRRDRHRDTDARARCRLVQRIPQIRPAQAIDFPIVNCAAVVTLNGEKVSAARICLNAVHVIPYRAVQAEKVIIGKIDEAVAEEAGTAAVAAAKPLEHNKYMVAVARTLVKRCLLACAGS